MVPVDSELECAGPVSSPSQPDEFVHRLTHYRSRASDAATGTSTVDPSLYGLIG